MSGWLHALATLDGQRTPAVLVTVVAAKGSVPRPPGTHMVVTADGLHDTIGGGHLELQAIAIARELIAGDAGGERTRRFPLGASLGQCCGGAVTLLFEPVAGPTSWVAQALALSNARIPFVAVAATTGEADAGRLLVTADTPGDAPAIAFARTLLRDGGAPALARCDVSPDAPARFFDPVRTTGLDVVLFGAGHVGRALVRVLATLDCRVVWVDARDDAFPPGVPANVTCVGTDAPEAEVDAAPPGAYFLVMTHDHAQDERLAERILRRDDFAYFGLIGSQSKRRQFEQRMARRGMPPARFAAMTCPIGVAGIPGKEPATIALAVAAQLLQVASAARSAAHGGPAADARRATSA